MKKRLSSTTLLCILLTACGGSGSSGSAAPAPAPTPAPPVAATPAPAVAINYRADLVPLLVGSYSGDCSQPPALAPVAATISVGTDGTVNSMSGSGNLLGNDVGLNFSRQSDSNGVQGFAFSGTIGFDTFGLILKGQSGAQAQGDVTTYSGSSSVVCKNSTDAGKLAAKSPFSPIEKYLTAPARDLSCIVGGSNVQTLRYQVLNGGATLGGETYPLTTGLKSQGVLVGPIAAIGELNYLVETLDNRSLLVVLDKFGALLQVSAKSGAGASYSCTPV